MSAQCSSSDMMLPVRLDAKLVFGPDPSADKQHVIAVEWNVCTKPQPWIEGK
jgi:hypothetical protein